MLKVEGTLQTLNRCNNLFKILVLEQGVGQKLTEGATYKELAFLPIPLWRCERKAQSLQVRCSLKKEMDYQKQAWWVKQAKFNDTILSTQLRGY